MLQAGVKDNVLPQKARAVINFRLVPGDTIDDVLAHVRKHVADDIEVLPIGDSNNPPKISSTESDAYRDVVEVTQELFPNVRVIPGMFPATTDSKHYAPIADDDIEVMGVAAAQ